jgi:hypothetical protein
MGDAAVIPQAREWWRAEDRLLAVPRSKQQIVLLFSVAVSVSSVFPW